MSDPLERDDHERQVSWLPSGPLLASANMLKEPSRTNILVVSSLDGSGEVLDLSGGKDHTIEQANWTGWARVGE